MVINFVIYGKDEGVGVYAGNNKQLAVLFKEVCQIIKTSVYKN